MPVITLLAWLLLSATGIISGTVGATGVDGLPFRMPGADVSLISSDGQILSAVTDDRGEFRFSEVPPGTYKLKVEMPGFQVFEKEILVNGPSPITEAIVLRLATVTERVEVTAETSQLSTSEASVSGRVEQKAIETVPLRNEQFIDTLPLIPGVVRGPDGLISVKGARSNESDLRVNASTATDPVTGQYAFKLPIEAVESVETLANPYSAEFGNFSSGVTRITTRTGQKDFHFDLHNPLPRLRKRDGAIRGIESVIPRVSFSGQAIPGKLYYSQSLEYRYIRTRVPSLPDLKNDTVLESFNSFTQLDYEISPFHRLTTTFSVFPEKLGFVGLNTFNPEEVTHDFRQRGFFFSVAERAIFGQGLLESTYSAKSYDANVRPNGAGTMFLAPAQNSGGFFNRQDRDSTLHEWVETYSFAPVEARGRHEVRVGTDISYNTFHGRNVSGPVEILSGSGRLLEQIDFIGDGRFSRNKTDLALFAQDTWNPASGVTLHLGLRYDRDSFIEENNMAPRIGLAISPWKDNRTIIRGGFGLFYGRVPLNVTIFDQTQQRVINQAVYRNVVDPGGLRTPYSTSWNIEVGRQIVENLTVRTGVQQRNGRRDFVLDPAERDVPVLSLDNKGSSRYREFNVTSSYRLGSRRDFVFSYVRSQAIGDLNDFNSHFGNTPRPVIRPNERSLLSFDVPHRFLFWGTETLPHGFTVSPVLEIRSGFPYSAVDENLNFAGPRNRAGRFPTFASLDLQVLKSLNIPIFGEEYHARVGFKIFNLAGHFNPRDIQDNRGAPDFGAFSNSIERVFRGKFVIDF